jgi:hypothetical protein
MGERNLPLHKAFKDRRGARAQGLRLVGRQEQVKSLHSKN